MRPLFLSNPNSFIEYCIGLSLDLYSYRVVVVVVQERQQQQHHRPLFLCSGRHSNFCPLDFKHSSVSKFYFEFQFLIIGAPVFARSTTAQRITEVGCNVMMLLL